MQKLTPMDINETIVYFKPQNAPALLQMHM